MLRILSPVLILVVVLGSCISRESASDRREYPWPFSPLNGVVHSEELPYRSELCLNGRWSFMPVYSDDIRDFVLPGEFQWDSVKIKIPSPWNVNSFAAGDGGDFVTFPSYPKAWERANIGWMRHEFVVPENWNKKVLKLHFEAIAGLSKIYINGRLAGENLDIFFPTEIDATPFVQKGTNEIIVGVAKASLTDKPGEYGRRNYVAGSFWGQHIAGIWQDVHLVAYPELTIKDVFINPDVKNNELVVTINVHNYSGLHRLVTPAAVVRSRKKEGSDDINEVPLPSDVLGAEVLNFSTIAQASIAPGGDEQIILRQKIDGQLDYWTPEHPNLYGITVELSEEENSIVDRKFARFGWRQFTIAGSQLLLNGQRIVLKGDSWHFMGIPQMTRRYAYAWFQMLKDANANAVRLHAQPYPSFYLDVADEMGICVLDETGIWSSDGGPKMDSDEYWSQCKQHVGKLVNRDRNHPSVFGWSVCNETLPVAIHVFHAPESIVQRQVDEINNWVSITREADPTRPWISGDGETMRPTSLPVVVGHYGDENSMKEWSSHGKPWGVGETGMAYYGTPRQVSAINGDRSYESQQGRMEGLAIEAQKLIALQNHHNATYSSIFNLAWYGLKPLEFGMADTTRAPIVSDGIFFPEYREGVAGVQPERLGPYTSTLNPGYDNKLPLYKPWPLFDAVKAANGTMPGYLSNASFKKGSGVKEKYYPVPLLNAWMGSADDSKIKQELESMGIVTGSAPSEADVLIIDAGSDLSTLSRQGVNELVQKGGSVVVFDVKPENLAIVNGLLPGQLELVKRTSTSFIVQKQDRLLNNLDNSDFYFSELTGTPVMSYGLAGQILDKGEVLLSACNTDWRRWNYKGEDIKTAAILRSERETKAAGNAIVKFSQGKGAFYLVAIDIFSLKGDGQQLIKTLLSNIGVGFRNVPMASQRALSPEHKLERAAAKIAMDTVLRSNAEGFIGLATSKSRIRSLSFWVFSPRSLVNLLAEPDIPALSMTTEGQEGLELLVDRKPVKATGQTGNSIVFDNLPLKNGWNRIEIKIPADTSDKPKMRVSFASTNETFIRELRSVVDR